MDIEKDSAEKHGNCLDLLKFRAEAGDVVLAQHLATSTRNATYTALDIQNQLMAILGNHIRDKILYKVKRAQFLFTVIADEVTDTSNN